MNELIGKLGPSGIAFFKGAGFPLKQELSDFAKNLKLINNQLPFIERTQYVSGNPNVVIENELNIVEGKLDRALIIRHPDNHFEPIVLKIGSDAHRAYLRSRDGCRVRDIPNIDTREVLILISALVELGVLRKAG